MQYDHSVELATSEEISKCTDSKERLQCTDSKEGTHAASGYNGLIFVVLFFPIFVHVSFKSALAPLGASLLRCHLRADLDWHFIGKTLHRALHVLAGDGFW